MHNKITTTIDEKVKNAMEKWKPQTQKKEKQSEQKEFKGKKPKVHFVPQKPYKFEHFVF